MHVAPAGPAANCGHGRSRQAQVRMAGGYGLTGIAPHRPPSAGGARHARASVPSSTGPGSPQAGPGPRAIRGPDPQPPGGGDDIVMTLCDVNPYAAGPPGAVPPLGLPWLVALQELPYDLYT